MGKLLKSITLSCLYHKIHSSFGYAFSNYTCSLMPSFMPHTVLNQKISIYLSTS